MSFDLNINNYQRKELEELLGLPNNYDEAVVALNEMKLRENINLDQTITSDVKNKTIDFLQKAKDTLVTAIKNEIFKKTQSLNIYNTDTSLRTSDLTTENGSQFIIDKPTIPFSQSFPNEFYPGIINPLKKRYTRQYLNIDTKFRDNYYATQSTNFHFDLPIKFSNVLSLQLASFEIETTYYVISKQYGNNFLWIIMNNGTRGLITVPDGNYSSVDLVSYLNNYLTAGPLIGTPFSNLLFTLNLNADKSGSGQIIIGYISSTPTGDIINFTLDFQSNLQGNPDYSTPLPLKFGWLLGYRLGLYENNINYVSEGIIDVNGPKYFYLAIDDYNNNVNDGFYSAFNSSILNKNILARLSYSNGSFSNVSQNNLSILTTPRQYFGPVDIQKLNIQLIDEYGRIIDLNNMDYSFCLTMQSVYDF
jgi:frataxin-like iron-binding protein CyaY